jgi:putative phosphoribosyl transferase
VEDLRCEVDDLVCLEARPDLGAVGAFYRDFRPTADEEVLDLLERSRREEGERRRASALVPAGGSR